MNLHPLPRVFALFILWFCPLYGQPISVQILDRELPGLLETYRYLHLHPEISYQEKKTSAFIARKLRALGFDVTEEFGEYPGRERTSYGVVGVMKNGPGPTVMFRTDLDGLPVEERTGLPYASTAKATGDDGVEVPVMHACGHDIHMTSFLGAATILSQIRNRWSGTLVFIGQPCEERGAGARAMLRGGLYTMFPKPDYILALHDNATMAAGTVGVCEGYTLASVTSVDITVRGIGGHGAYPQATKDPVVVAAQIVLALQTIVSRENSPFNPAVVTVGSIHGGTKHNIIPDEVRLQITVRAYKEEVRKKILASIERIAKGTALAAGIPADRMPIVSTHENEFTAATFNNPGFTRRVSRALELELGTTNVVRSEPVMGGEDFGEYSLNDSIPLCMFWLGAVDPSLVEKSVNEGTSLPSLHSSQFAPASEATIRTGMRATAAAVLDLLKK